MTTLTKVSRIRDVDITDDTLIVCFEDRSSQHIPLSWYPRLKAATAEERSNWRLVGNGQGIHWETLDEDISLDGIINRRISGESPASFQRWLDSRN